MKYKNYIFDFDNTIFDTTKGSSIVYENTFKQFNLAFDIKNVPQYLSEALKESFNRVTDDKVNFKEFEEIFYAESDIFITKHAELFSDAKDSTFK